MDFKTLSVVLSNILSAEDSSCNYPVMIRGRHGIGKSQVVYQLAKKLGMKVVERRASQMQEGDLVGMPSQTPKVTDKGTEVSSFNSFEWFVECCENPRVLFFDEVDRGEQQVRQGIMELTDSRKLFGKVLHPNTIIIAAVNGGKHGTEYQVGEMDPAELDRWTIFDVEPSVDDWLDWASDKVNPLMWNFVKTLTRAGFYDNIKQNLDSVMNISMGFIGLGSAAALREFALNFEYQLTAEDIVDHGRWAETTEWGVNEHLSMTTKLSNSGMLDNELDERQLANVANYFITLPSEVAAQFFVMFCGKAEDDFQNPNLANFTKTRAHTGVSVAEHYGQILTGNVISDK